MQLVFTYRMPNIGNGIFDEITMGVIFNTADINRPPFISSTDIPQLLSNKLVRVERHLPSIGLFKRLGVVSGILEWGY